MEQPLKRLRRRNRDGQMSAKHTSNNPVTKTPLIRPKEEYAEFPESVAENIMVKSEPETGQSTPATCHSLDHNKGKQPVVHETSDPVQKSGVDGSHQSTPLRPEPVHPMRLRDRGTGSVTSRIPSKKKKPVTTECSSRDVRLEELKVEFLSSTEKISARRVLIKPKDDPITDDNLEAPIEVTHLDPLNGGNPSSRDDSIKKDYGREPTIRSRNQLKTANGTASSNEPRNKGKVAMPLDSNGKVDGSELNKMDTRVESQSVNGKKEINAKLINKNRVTPETIKSLDIAKGQEKVVITMANEVNDERPPHFYYIPRNAIFENAYVNVSLARIGDVNSCANCDGDCLSLETPCVCSYETGGEFAYTADGLVKEELLKESISMNRDPEKHCQFFCKECPLERSKNEDTVEPCKGHLVRKFIKECWLKCGCDQLCGNRVVQRGISRKLQVFMTPGGKGWGLRTLEDLPEGAFVCEYVGEVLTNAELFDRVLRKPKGEKHSYPVLLDADWCVEGVLKDEDALCLDATYYGNVARFINHRCHDSNLVEIPVEVETPDHHYYHLAFFTTRKVKAMEELTWDYGIDFDDTDHPIKAFRCQCGSKFCRNIKRSRSRRIKRW